MERMLYFFYKHLKLAAYKEAVKLVVLVWRAHPD